MSAIGIRCAESALADLADIKRWYLERGVPDTGSRLIAEIFERIEVLPDPPGIGRIVPEFRQKSLRELIHPPFRIVYRREANQIRIVRVWRSERVLRLVSGEAENEC
ncbi:type II toxin-antitoxin system RelE/ParE family toxin [Candidatus Thiosymbion oneisti]|uniref:type II toxin-antitoxin system RelE/ParE family toxin n=1 Tax=Candidatus Thiosymbion oneisti TaxID=589554 RepID=UPI000AD4C40D|nr:type II toxin-antitoxin system RelE/ParE family toxin [Candidatus Thiosymbion oneisti]